VSVGKSRRFASRAAVPKRRPSDAGQYPVRALGSGQPEKDIQVQLWGSIARGLKHGW